jgi:predicted ester cyclase
MSSEANKDFVRGYLGAISGKAKTAALVSQFVDDRELEDHIAMFEAAFPKYELLADDLVADGDKVAVRATFRGKQADTFQGIPATGRDVNISLMLIYRIANGRIVEHWMNADSLSLLQQLGAIPAPEAAAAV